MKKILVAFVPVIHKGYIDLFNKYPEGAYIFGKSFIEQFTSLTRDVRVVDPREIALALKAIGYKGEIGILNEETALALAKENCEIIMPYEDVSKVIADKYFKDNKVEFVNTFLRWDKIITTREFVIPEHRKKTNNPEDREMLANAFKESEKSSDWWRQIGAVVVKDGKVIIASHNRHMPTDYHLSIFGDPRSNFDAGERLDIYTSIHGEADIIAKAAKQGVSLSGATLYVTTFPCSNCARLLGEAGIKKVIYSKGYSRLDAEDILNSYGVEILLVE
jgi:dCMP deaminase